MKKVLSFIVVVAILFSFMSCGTKGTGDAIPYYSSKLRVVNLCETNSNELSKNTKKGDICKYGECLGYTGDPSGWDAIGAIFGGNNYVQYCHIKQCEIDNCVVWESLYTTTNMDIQLSSITTSSCTQATSRSVGIAAEKSKGSIKASGSYNYTSSSSSTVEYAKGTVHSFDIFVDELNTNDYEYARAILADVEIIVVYKVTQKVEWFQTKYYFEYDHAYLRITDRSSMELVMLYKEIDYR